ncbi:MAG: hypothetical protein IMY67_08190 [Bacteroidetes bacterium]|nr:hypothetical protein [Bacteroidota bacterium]
MKPDDKIRNNYGLVTCLRDMGNGNSRIFFDDVKANKTKNPINWEYDCFFTFTDELENNKTDNMQLTDNDFMKIGEAVVARLLALNGRVK